MMLRLVRSLLVPIAIVSLAGCSADDSVGEPTESDGTSAETPAEGASEQKYPDVVDVEVDAENGTFAFSVTMSSPYDSPKRYADGWRVKGADGTVFGEHTLMHDHAGEQPFTRTQSGVTIPSDVTEVVVEGRDQRHGYGGETKTVVVR